jgi:hypothetical protein
LPSILSSSYKVPRPLETLSRTCTLHVSISIPSHISIINPSPSPTFTSSFPSNSARNLSRRHKTPRRPSHRAGNDITSQHITRPRPPVANKQETRSVQCSAVRQLHFIPSRSTTAAQHSCLHRKFTAPSLNSGVVSVHYITLHPLPPPNASVCKSDPASPLVRRQKKFCGLESLTPSTCTTPSCIPTQLPAAQ